MYIRSRREFLRDTVRSITALGATGAMAGFGEMNALAAGGSRYQALVCVFLLGGNDGHNTVIPIATSQQNYGQYQKYRGGLTISQGSLLPILNGADTYGLHPSLPEIQGLYSQGKVAVLANVGMLVEPITRAVYLSNNSAIVPSALFSHSDQSNQWQTAIPNGIASSGWGGRITDLMQGQNGGAVFPPITTTASCGLFCTGQQTFPATVPPPSSGSGAATGIATLSGLQSAPSRATGMQQLLTFDNGLKLVQSGNRIMTRGNNYATTLTNLLTTVTVKTPSCPCAISWV